VKKKQKNQFPINQIFKDEIKKKINLKKDLKTKVMLTFKTCDLDHEFITNLIEEKP
jgi:hypothetical protein